MPIEELPSEKPLNRWREYKQAEKIGVGRNRSARWRAKHLLIRNCGISQASMAAPESFKEMVWIKNQEFDKVAKLVEEKMKAA